MRKRLEPPFGLPLVRVLAPERRVDVALTEIGKDGSVPRDGYLKHLFAVHSPDGSREWEYGVRSGSENGYGQQAANKGRASMNALSTNYVDGCVAKRSEIRQSVLVAQGE